MKASDIPRAMAAGAAIASAAGLTVDDASVIHGSNRIAIRLLPCGALARVAYEAHRDGAQFEVDVARSLTAAGCTVAEPDPRVKSGVQLYDGFAITLWPYYNPLPSKVAPAEYARVLLRLHEGMRQVEVAAPRFTDRAERAASLLRDYTRTPSLAEADRELLVKTLETSGSPMGDSWQENGLTNYELH